MFKSHRSTMATSAILVTTVLWNGSAMAESWQIVMNHPNGSMSWSLDEEMGVRMAMPSQPNMEIILRTDRKQTIYVKRSFMHSAKTREAVTSSELL